MDAKTLIEISRVIVDEHSEDVGRWMSEIHVASPLYLMLAEYQTAQFFLLRELREYIDSGSLPRVDKEGYTDRNRIHFERVAKRKAASGED